MLIGFGMPMGGALASPGNLVEIAAGGEAMGYDYATFSDHIVIPTDIQARYPYSEGGEFPPGARGERHEQLTTVAFIAARTSRLRLVTSVMVVPHRPAVLAAKILATIDVLSGGRLTVGIGAGWLREEFDAIAAPPFAERGQVTDDTIGAFKALWTEARPHYSGRHVQFADIVFAPKPVQRPHPPIWVGGESGPALRRSAKLGDGWYPIGTNPSHPLDSLPLYQEAIGRLRQLTAAAGRPADAVALAYRVQRHGDALPATAGDGARKLFSGSAADLADDARALRDLGVTSLDFAFSGADARAMLEQMQAFRDEVLAKI